MSAHKDRRHAHPSTPEVPTTLKRDRVVHEVSHVQVIGHSPLTGKTNVTYRTRCGIYESVDDGRAFVKNRLVNCLDCIAEPNIVPIQNGDTVGFVTKTHDDGTVTISMNGWPVVTKP